MADRIPSPEDIERTVRDSGPFTLRALCRVLWPGVSWRTALLVPRAWPGEVQASLADWLAAQLSACDASSRWREGPRSSWCRGRRYRPHW